MIQINTFTFNSFQENTYVLVCSQTRACAIIDPGCSNRQEENVLVEFIEKNQLQPMLLLNTHCHIDHILGNLFIANKYKLPLHLHQEELFTYKDANKWSAMLGIAPIEIPEELVFIDEKNTITFGDCSLQIALTPGHSIASLCFFNLEQNICVSGDVLFYESIGRTDLPSGNFETLIHSIKGTLFAWSDEMRIFPGHGPASTIGHEKRFNPFLT
jgi:glyoxylase-like metal-dependent hydrolase (beta-lactamase superfamily II)